MNDAHDLFVQVCEANDTLAAVAGLSGYEFQLLYGLLIRGHSEHGITGRILGMMCVEGAARFVAAHQPKKTIL